jgi:hypothetical protein
MTTLEIVLCCVLVIILIFICLSTKEEVKYDVRASIIGPTEASHHHWIKLKNGDTLRLTKGQYQEAMIRANENKRDNPFKE